MKVLKFGGTSVGTAAGIKNVKEIIYAENGKKIVVLSAMSGVTNNLVDIIGYLKNGDRNLIEVAVNRLRKKHVDLIEALFPASEEKKQAFVYVEELFLELEAISKGIYVSALEPIILTFGETLLTTIFSSYLEAEAIENTLLDSKDFMHVPNLENPDVVKVGKLLHQALQNKKPSEIYIAQGFVCIDGMGNINTLKRGGSDYTATIIAAAVGAREVQIWTDIDGFHNNDPRYVENTSPIPHLTFEEAAELAYFGAKVLHPQTVQPVKEQNIPIYLKNTFKPLAVGTKISSEAKKEGLKAISAKDGITAIKIKSNRMLMAHGFLRKIFEVFDKYETAIDMITTSEIAISLTIDEDRNLEQILDELKNYGEISVDKNHSIICIVGESVINDSCVFKLFGLLNTVPVRMISYGGSNNNISLLVNTQNKIQTLQLLHKKLFEGNLVGL